MIFEEIVKGLQKENLVCEIKGNIKTAVSSVTDDSREAGPQSLFICKGAGFKREYLESAVKSGAVCTVSEKDYGIDIPTVIVSDIRRALAVCAFVFYRDPSADIKAVGITGTKGKTTTGEMIHTILSVSSKCATIGTNGVDTTAKLYDNTLTTPESLYINKYLREAADNGAPFAVVETSAQAFKVRRTDLLQFEIGVFTNFGLDHIGPKEHPDVEDYFKCKMKLFSQCKKAVVYGDGEEFPKIKEYLKDIPYYTFGMSEKNDFSATDIESDGKYLHFKLKSKYLSGDFALSMLGDFNVINALAAICCCHLLGASVEDMKKGLSRVFVSGRMEIFEAAGRTVIVDYAHNKLSYERLIDNIDKTYPGRRKVSVFGCPGTKALNRRKDMGETAADRSDFTVITAEDPDTEPVEKTMDEIASYLDKKHAKYVKIASRPEAVEYAVRNSERGDVIMVLGKGNEKTMMYDGKFLAHEGDSDIASRLVKELKEKEIQR